MKHFYLLTLLFFNLSFGQMSLSIANTEANYSTSTFSETDWQKNAITPTLNNLNNTTGFNSDIQQNEIKIFPNPVLGNQVTIATTKPLLAEIYDVLGKKVKTQQITPNENKINIASLKKGVYLVKLKTDTDNITKKLIRQ